MQYSKKVFCELVFLKEMCMAIAENSLLTFEEQKVWKSIYNFLTNANIEFHLDVSDEEWGKAYKEAHRTELRAAKRGENIPKFEYLLSTMYDAAYANQGRFQFKANFIPLSAQSTGLDRNGLYLSMLNENDCKRLSDKSGCMIISPDNIKRLAPITNDSGWTVRKGDSGTWEQLLAACKIGSWKKIPCNSLTIVDNYLLADTVRLTENLGTLLRILLPQNYASVFPIKIISKFRTSQSNELPFGERWNLVKSIISNLKRPYDISLSMVKCGDNVFHDRTIYTDNMWISCGAGFDLYNKGKATKSTIVNVVSPFLNDTIQWAFMAYGNLVDETTKLIGEECGDFEGLKNPDAFSRLKHEEVLHCTL